MSNGSPKMFCTLCDLFYPSSRETAPHGIHYSNACPSPYFWNYLWPLYFCPSLVSTSPRPMQTFIPDCSPLGYLHAVAQDFPSLPVLLDDQLLTIHKFLWLRVVRLSEQWTQETLSFANALDWLKLLQVWRSWPWAPRSSHTLQGTSGNSRVLAS